MAEPSEISPKPRVPWPRIVAEGVAIVVSILLAFALQAWWDGSQRRADERDLLVQLDAELVGVDSVLTEWASYHTGVLEAAEALLAQTGPFGSASLQPDSIGALIWTVIVTWGVDPPTATINSLESSGRIGLIRSQEIVTQLTLWRSILVDLQKDEMLLQEYTYRTIMPYLMAHASYRSVVAHADDPSYIDTPSGFPDGLVEVLADREFEGHVEEVRTESVNILGNYDDVRASLTDLRSTIRGELGG